MRAMDKFVHKYCIVQLYICTDTDTYGQRINFHSIIHTLGLTTLMFRAIGSTEADTIIKLAEL